MIVTDLVETVAYRVHVPRWASMPTSGAGAAQHGGRANRPGVEAVYLSLELDTAVREYQQLSPLMPPGTLVSYHLTVHQVVDFRDGFQASHWDPLWEQFLEDWRQLWFNQRTEPPSWVLGDQVREAGRCGILFPSQVAAGGINLVLYPDRLRPEDHLNVYDPGQQLPKNQASWR